MGFLVSKLKKKLHMTTATGDLDLIRNYHRGTRNCTAIILKGVCNLIVIVASELSCT